jgi:hypothetical protein
MPNKEISKSQNSSTQKPLGKEAKETKAVETGEFEIEGTEHLGEDSEETDYEITGRESLIPKKDDRHKTSKH